MKSRSEPKAIWFVECVDRLWRPARPAHAFPLIREMDLELERVGTVLRRVRVFANFAALYSETNENFDGAELYWIADFDAGRCGMMMDEARLLSVQHPTPEMRSLYARCTVHLTHELSRKPDLRPVRALSDEGGLE